MPSPFYPRRPGCTLRVLPAVWAALSLGLPALAEAGQIINITENVSHDVFGNGDPDDNGKDKRPTLPFAAPSSNTITVSNGMVTGIAYGGYSGDSTAATGNSVTVSGGTVSGGLYGGFSANSGAAMGNSVTVSGGTVGWDVYGGWTSSGSATNNTVTVNGGSIGRTVYGGRSDGSGSVTGNSVTVSGSGSVSGDVIGGYSDSGTVTGNSMTISGGSVAGYVYGGYSDSGAVTNNHATVSGGSVTEGVYGGLSDSGSATGNSVTISGGTVGWNVYGGWSGFGPATNNTVTLSGGSVTGTVYGGQVSSGSGDVFTGNTLNVTASGLSVGGDLKNFQYLNFYLPSTLAAGTTMLTVTGTADLTNGAGGSSTVNVGIAGSSSHLAVGQTVTLISAGTLTTASGLNSTANGRGMQGVTLAYVFDLDADATTLTATVTSAGAAEGSKALSESVLSSAALAAQGGDMAAGEAMAQAVSAGSGGGMGGGFGAVSGGSMRYNSGSHSDVSSVSLATGFAKGIELDQGQVILGAFLEYGNGSYDAYNSFSTGRTHGKGDMDYVGVGVLGRMDFAQEGPGHAYTEASLRLGRTHNKYDSADLGGGIGAHYKTSPAYYGGHVGAGYVWDIAPKTALDLSAKYLVTHQNASRVTLGSGDDIRFDSVTSKRTRLGGRASYAATDRISPYAGVAWEYEFDARADATTSGVAIDAPSLKGGTGIGELGVAIKPSVEMPLSLDLGLQGYTGKREGVTGSLKAVFRF